jgi:hypothetical protein
MLPIGLSHVALIMLRNILSIPTFVRALTMKRCWILSKDFLHLLRRSCDFCPCFCLYLVLNLQIYVYWTILHIWNETKLVTCYWIIFSSIIWEFLWLCSWMLLICNSLFLLHLYWVLEFV